MNRGLHGTAIIFRVPLAKQMIEEELRKICKRRMQTLPFETAGKKSWILLMNECLAIHVIWQRRERILADVIHHWFPCLAITEEY